MKNFIQTVNPYSQELLQSYRFHDGAEIEKKLAIASALYFKNISNPVDAKSSIQRLRLVAERLRNKERHLAQLMVNEIGKTITDAKAEINKSIETFEFAANNYANFLEAKRIGSSPDFEILKQPLGVVLAIMPWNYPLWQVVRVLVSCLAVGNPMLLKHAENASGFAEEFEKIFSDELEGYLINLRVPVSDIEKIIADRRVCGVSLTGSVRAGKAVGYLAGKYLKKSVLELGGSDAYVVLKDADLRMAAKICAQARMVNNGQSCIAAKRIIVDGAVSDEFSELLVRELSNFIPQDPNLNEAKVASLAGGQYKQCLLEQCELMERKGGEKIWDLADGLPAQFADHPTIFPARIYEMNRVEHGLADVELFGPVVQMATFSDEPSVAALVNSCNFGLGAAIFSQDKERAELLAKKFEVGMVGINAQVKSDVKYPFGGCKDSGYGRELGLQGFDEFVLQKVIIRR